MKKYIIWLLVLISLSVSACFFLAYGSESYPFYGDSMGYYMYLPSTFIYHNHKALDWLPADKHVDGSVRSYLKAISKDVRSPKGYVIDKYTYGVAAMEAPFFFVAHAYEKLKGTEANGYSASYRNMLKLSSFIYGLLGLLLLYNILGVFFSKELSLTGTLVVFTGTNLFWFMLHQAGMAHVPVFFLYALLLYATILLHRQPKMFLFLLAGAAAGLITIIRPTDIVCLLIPLCYNVYDRRSLAKKASFIKTNYKGVLIFTLAFVAALLPQMLYWKKFAGSFIYYSYGAESFNWLNPKILGGLFSFKNGWLIYTPVMIFALAGLMLYKRIKPVALILYVLLPVYIYVIYCWYCWYYINGLGSRPMVNIYALLAIPLTAFIQYTIEQKIYWKITVSALFMFFVSLNIAYSFQEAKGILISEESNKEYNIHMLFKMSASYNDLVLYDIQQVQPAAATVEKTATLACENYEDSVSDHYVPDPTLKSRYVYHMQQDEEYHPKKITVNYNKALFKNAQWLKCSGSFLCTKPYLYLSIYLRSICSGITNL